MAYSRDEDITAALRSCRTHFAFAATFNAVANVLLLSYPIYMMAVFQGALEARSVESLIALFIGFLLAILFKSTFEWVRAAMLVRASLRIDRRLSERLVSAQFLRRAAGTGDAGGQVVRDLELFRNYVTGNGGSALLEAPWGAFYIAVLLVLDPLIGAAAACSTVVTILLECLKAARIRRGVGTSSASSVASFLYLDRALQGAEAVVGMGMIDGMLRKWGRLHEDGLWAQASAQNVSASFNAISNGAALLSQGVVLGVAALQVMKGNAPASITFVAILLFQFANRPFRRVVTAWTDYIPVRQGLARIEDILAAVPPVADRMTLPRPSGELTVKGVNFMPRNHDRFVLRNISFGVEAGQTLGIVGLVGSGKSSLARLLVGCVKPSTGHVRLDGSDLWDRTQSGNGGYVGYLPQGIALLPATVAENIGRFGEFDEAAIVRAAQLAGAHDFILRLPKGYDTLVGEGGHPVSGGQRQLIALARAAVGEPSLVVLDEPNSNLDGPSEDALMTCVAGLKERGTTVVMISHRPTLVRQMDKILLLKEGEVVGFGDADVVYQRLGRPTVVKRQAANAG